MKSSKVLFLFLSVMLVAGNAFAKDAKKKVEKTDSLQFTVIKENPITSVKNQNKSGTCWSYSSLGFFEAEILKATGKTYDLSEPFLVKHTYIDRATAAIRTHGDVSYSQGGSFYDALYCLRTNGICPEEAMPVSGSLTGDTIFNFNELFKVSTAYVEALAKGDLKKLTPAWRQGYMGILDAYIGKFPTTFSYQGKEYTPQTFVKDLGINLDDYVSLTSFTHHPFYSQFVIEVQDNWRWALSYNLPLDEFMEVMDSAIRNGYTFAWGSDVSEPSFRGHEVVLMPEGQQTADSKGSDQARWTGKNPQAEIYKQSQKEVEVTQELRQTAYDNWETTDDHGMLIYGLVKDQNGKEYFMMKNSWGKYNKMGGKCYISKAFVAYKTMNILINKKAIPAAIAKKLGL